MRNIKEKIRKLEQQLASMPTHNATAAHSEESQLSTDEVDTSSETQATKRAKWRARKKEARRSEIEAKQKEVVKSDTAELMTALEAHRKRFADLKAAKVEQAEQYEQVKSRREELQKRRQDLAGQLQKKVRTAPPETTTRQEDSFDLGDILDDAVAKTAKSARREREASSRPVLDFDLFATNDDGLPMSLSSQNEDLDSQEAQEHSLDPSIPSKQAGTSTRPSDNLRLSVPPSGKIPIDADLTVSLTADTPDLQSQAFQMQQRLKASYPRIDNLPYNVWTSTNKKTLQTWLKIMITRWQKRFDGAMDKHDEPIVDERVQMVLDQMVRDHDLGNEAAERMAVRWHEVFNGRGDMTSDVAGVIDWDEFDAGGMGFLIDDPVDDAIGDAEIASSGSTEFENTATPSYTTSGRYAKPESPTYNFITKRLYSTSSRPPPDPSVTVKPTSSTSNKTSTSLPSSPPPSLPHLTPTGSAHMVSVSTKPHTIRTAIAIGTVHFSNPTALTLIRSNALKKGDVLSVSRIAGIIAAKKCPDLIPLCHPIALTHVGVELKVLSPTERLKDGPEGMSEGEGMGFGGISIEAKVQCTGPTGVEMEALTSVMGAALSVVDMCKAVDKYQRIDGVRVVLKEGGRSGVWREEGWKSFQTSS
jgi:molybdenum cofactor biosynthesis enzyme